MRSRALVGGFGAVIGAFILAAIVANSRNSQELSRLKGLSESRPAPNWPKPNEIPPARQVAIAYARSMIGTPYDPLMGMYGDPLGRLGLVVCIDVPIRAYMAAGIPLPELLRDTARAHPEVFNIAPSNSPKSSFFYRRVRNYSPLFRSHPLLEASQTPLPGDLAFYGSFHIALVADVRPDGSFDVVEASPRKGRVALSDGAYMERTWGKPAFFGRISERDACSVWPCEVVRMGRLFR